ncbi:hypothetical protein BC826DRAFT_973994 [Russula brevipes]|nr:hypothetical protein BC826DRAFT_973994 [Russula brevipes]
MATLQVREEEGQQLCLDPSQQVRMADPDSEICDATQADPSCIQSLECHDVNGVSGSDIDHELVADCDRPTGMQSPLLVSNNPAKEPENSSQKVSVKPEEYKSDVSNTYGGTYGPRRIATSARHGHTDVPTYLGDLDRNLTLAEVRIALQNADVQVAMQRLRALEEKLLMTDYTPDPSIPCIMRPVRAQASRSAEAISASLDDDVANGEKGVPTVCHNVWPKSIGGPDVTNTVVRQVLYGERLTCERGAADGKQTENLGQDALMGPAGPYGSQVNWEMMEHEKLNAELFGCFLYSYAVFALSLVFGTM